MATEKIKAYRVTFIVDEDAFAFLAKSHGFTEDGEIWIWENTEDIEYEVAIPCEDCGSRGMMEEFACPYNEGYCTDCCYCETHWPEIDQSCNSCGDDLNDSNASKNPKMCVDCYKDAE